MPLFSLFITIYNFFISFIHNKFSLNLHKKNVSALIYCVYRAQRFQPSSFRMDNPVFESSFEKFRKLDTFKEFLLSFYEIQCENLDIIQK
jgi:hypothetical protein